MTTLPTLSDRQLPRQWRLGYEDPELAREFRAAPLGPHSERLRRLLEIMKAATPVAGRPVIVEREDGRMGIGVLPALLGDPIQIVGDPVEAGDWAEAERRAFAIRWRVVFGAELPA